MSRERDTGLAREDRAIPMCKTTDRTIPDGMREVSKEEFFATVGSMNVHPRPMPDHSEWIDQQTYREVGRSWPGYRNPSDAHAYAIRV